MEKEYGQPIDERYYGVRWIAKEADFYIDVFPGFNTGFGHKAVLELKDKTYLICFGTLTNVQQKQTYFAFEMNLDSQGGYTMDRQLFGGDVKWIEGGESFCFRVGNHSLFNDLGELTFVRARIPFAELPQNAPKKK